MTRRRGAADQAARRRLVPEVEGGRATCRRCGHPIRPGQAWDAGHVADLVDGGHPAGPVRPEHASCNRSAGAKVGNARRRRPTRRRLADWLE